MPHSRGRSNGNLVAIRLQVQFQIIHEAEDRAFAFGMEKIGIETNNRAALPSADHIAGLLEGDFRRPEHPNGLDGMVRIRCLAANAVGGRGAISKRTRHIIYTPRWRPIAARKADQAEKTEAAKEDCYFQIHQTYTFKEVLHRLSIKRHDL